MTDEAPGTYTATVYAVLAADSFQQTMKFSSLQIGTNAVESTVVTKASCAACHQGPISGKLYMHHIYPGRSPAGSFAYEYEPVVSCKACHNNDGYAAYTDAAAPGGRVADPIIRCVHGVHMGELLSLDFNTNSTTGDFRDYTKVAFPADVRNCTTCHQDDRWKTVATRQACGTCHDNVWFDAKAAMPTNRVFHTGLTQTNDSKCSLCHDAANIADAHAVSPPAPAHLVTLAMSAPANGKFYVAGESPKVTIQVKDAKTSQTINPTNMVDPLVSTNMTATEWNRANLFVSGPRSLTVPVLTTAITNTIASSLNNELRYMRDATKRDPRTSRTPDSIIYQLDNVAKVVAGTYTVYAELRQASTGFSSTAYLNFQVGSTNVEPMVATGCIDCHGTTRMHATSRAVTFTPDICKSCHDYQHQMTGKTNWLNSQYGFGVSPLSRRVHGIHYGKYTAKPNEITSNSAFAYTMFTQDVRNCTKCHSQSTSWNEKPSHLACFSCHDDDMAQTHGKLMTYDPTPQDPWSGDEVETCIICHGKDADFSPSKVHAISNPYVPIYLRAPRP